MKRVNINQPVTVERKVGSRALYRQGEPSEVKQKRREQSALYSSPVLGRKYLIRVPIKNYLNPFQTLAGTVLIISLY